MKQFLLAITLLLSLNTFAQTLEADRLALVALYNSTNGSGWTNKTGWTVPGTVGDNPCGWYGVSCNAGRVININLSNNHIVGTIPIEIGNLTNLQYLTLDQNQLTGSISGQIGNLSQLTYLSLSSNQLSGNLPLNLFNLSQLGSMHLGSNQLTGSIPEEFIHLSHLVSLSLNNNHFSGNIPVQMGGVTTLKYLGLSANQLTGTIPAELGFLPQLLTLDLFGNQFSGNIPPQLAFLSLLTNLSLGGNQLTGSIPAFLGSLSNLKYLYLNGNQFSGNIPAELGNLSNLQTLWLGYNQLSGTLPPLTSVPAACYVDISTNKFSFDGLETNISKLDNYYPQAKITLNYSGGVFSVNAGGTLTNNTYRWYRDNVLIATNVGSNSYATTANGNYRVDVTNSVATDLTLSSENFRIGSDPLETDRLALIALYNATNGANWTNKTNWLVPGTIGDSPCGWYGVHCYNGRVDQVSLFNNNLVGTIPAAVGNLKGVERFDLSVNHVSGTIPIEFGSLPKVWGLYLSNNQLTGTIPAELGNLPLLKQLSLGYNQLSGSIPLSITNLTNLDALLLNTNQLSGTIPSQLGNLINMKDLYLSNNQFSGSIPSSIGNILGLVQMYLNDNQLSGAIPTTLSSLTSLKYLSLKNNQLSGSIPAQLGNLGSLISMYLSQNNLTGSIPSSLGNLVKLEALDLQQNQFTGSIPTSLGNLVKLTYLTLAINQLTGPIPSELGNLALVQSLYLYGNQLSGAIPSSLGNLPVLKYLYIHSNNLSGPLPNLSNIPITGEAWVFSNKLTFDGMETNISRLDYYSPQAKISLNYSGGAVSVNAGGTIANNTYKWYRDEALVQTNVGNNSYTLPGIGTYRVEVTNSIATSLTLISDNFIQSTPLPVTLVNFIGKKSGDVNLLQWSTTAEADNSGFEIERSTDARSFTKIGFADGKGESKDLEHYQFVDHNPVQITYYRLKQLDFDGSFAYSRIIKVQSEVTSLIVYPNPVKGLLTIESLQSEKSLQIYDLKGIQIFQKPSLSSQTISTVNWNSGTYIIKVGDETEKIVVEN